jgi:hypothetical protein
MSAAVATALIIVLSFMLVAARDSTRQPPDDQERTAGPAWWFLCKLSRWPFAVLWTTLNVTTALLVLFVITGDRGMFSDRQGHIAVLTAFGLFSLVVIGAMMVSQLHFIWWRYSWFVLFGAVFWCVLLLTSLAIVPTEPRQSGRLQTFLQRPGTLFAAILGLVTIIGFIITISHLHETNARITDYPTLLQRLAFLLEEAVGPVTGWRRWSPLDTMAHKFSILRGHGLENEEHVRIYVRTLALGSMSTPQQVFDRYGRALRDLFAHGRSVVVQLDHSNLTDLPASSADIGAIETILSGTEVGRLYLHFKNRGFQAHEIAAGYREAQRYGVWPHQRGVRLADIADRKVLRAHEHIYCLRPSDRALPSYHLFVSSRRAIVITALDLPIGSDGSDNMEGWKRGPVHVVAVETTNVQVVAELIRTFDAIFKQCSETAVVVGKETATDSGRP